MKIRLQDVVKYCYDTNCDCCKYSKNGDCIVRINGHVPKVYIDYCWLYDSLPELAKELYTNEEVDIYENDSERTN